MEEILNKHEDISLESTEIIPDAKNEIMNTLNEKIKSKTINSVIFSGGTGLSPKDMTYDLIEPKIEKKIDGFGELFRALSYEEIGASAMLSRATAGKIKDKIVFLLPGSPNTVKLALEKLILPEIGHILYIINKKE
jgi:molybdopterin adenylyltransferase